MDSEYLWVPDFAFGGAMSGKVVARMRLDATAGRRSFLLNRGNLIRPSGRILPCRRDGG